ncbi:sulfoquinovosidase-like [Impatiens glandulifera]|uniref:sulfoquinovosidase-like n=1 Tax=Impatiens glandulifera TaxID=253017 RepID=UPI001FB19EEC|nr:sulfoquinovosidase-like [Impatiens glandulifera]
MANLMKITKKHHKHLNNPFPSAPSSLPFIQGTLKFNLQSLDNNPSNIQNYPIGNDFHLTCTTSSNNVGGGGGGGGYLSVSHRSHPSKILWSTVPGRAFINAAISETEVEESRGSFLVRDRKLHLVCDHQTIDDIMMIHDTSDDPNFLFGYSGIDHKNSRFPVLVITGKVFTLNKKNKKKQIQFSDEHEERKTSVSARYWLFFEQKGKNSNQLGFHVKLGKPDFRISTVSNFFPWKLKRMRRHGWWWNGKQRRSSSEESLNLMTNSKKKKKVWPEFNRVCLTYVSEKDEKFYGFGEQFSHMNFKGKRVPILVQEQGIGRGDQPITFAANLISYRSGGDWSTTYAPSPFYITSKMRSLYLEGYNYSVFDLTRHDRVQIQMHGNSIEGRILNGESPLELIENFTEAIGRPPRLPAWITSGAIVGMQGGTELVRQAWSKLQLHEIPISAFWLQDWVGQRKTVIGSQLWWNWEVDMVRYEGWQRLIGDLNEHGIKMMTYCNPCLAQMDDKPNWKRNLFEEAKSLDILVKDENGESYMVPNTAFDVGMLDLTHPQTSSWFKKILHDMVDEGVRGWMADFGEGLPVDACLYSGEDPISAHNRYPELWAKINREFVEEWKIENEGKDDDDGLVFFMRAGFTNSPRWGMLLWEGDQMVSWQANDGIKSAVVGLLSSGISGYAFNHSDIGGYCAVDLPFLKYRRSEELLLRWMELSAFTTVFRTHEGNRPGSNSQFYTNDKTISHFARFAKVYKAWEFYRAQLIEEAARKGLPVCRHLFLHYPNEERVQQLTYQQFLVGEEILVAPVLDKGKKRVKVYFPLDETCTWKHIWTGELYTKPGSEEWVEASLGYPAVFVKVDSYVGQTFLKNLTQFSLL